MENLMPAGKVLDSDRTTVLGACPHDCPDTCSMITTVQDGQAIALHGNPDHPFTRGTLCGKVDKFLDRVYSPERVLYPLRRVGEKGSGQFERISWDTALIEIRDRFQQIIAEYSAEAIMPYCFSGHQGILNGLMVSDAFFNRLGATIAEKTLCSSGCATAFELSCGLTYGLDPEAFVKSKYIVLWASNVITTNLHLWHFITEARKQGAKLVVIDPVHTRTARQADWHLAIRPGTDAALALGMMHVIIQENLIDADYIEKYTVGYAELQKRVQEFPVDRVAAITGIPAEDIQTLAREYARTQPSVIRLGVALERQIGGGNAIRAICCLPALVGSWRYIGGGLLQATLWPFPLKFDVIQRPDLIKPGTRIINQWHLGAALTGNIAVTPPVQALFVCNSNPLLSSADQGRMVAGLSRLDLFTVVSEQFITDTARFADIILPATTQIEQLEIMFSWGHLYLTYNPPAISPLGEAVSNTELFRRLAAVMEFQEDCFQLSDEQMIQEFLDWSAPVMEGISLDLLKQQGYAKLKLSATPHAEGNFPTPSGKMEFVASLAPAGNFVISSLRQGLVDRQSGEAIDPLPNYIPPTESTLTNLELVSQYPLNLLSIKPHFFLNSSYGNLPKHLKLEGSLRVLIHPQDAITRNISHRQPVRVFNNRGEFQAIAYITENVRPGIVAVPLGHWCNPNSTSKTMAALVSTTYSDLGKAGAVSDTLVEVQAISK
jgi:anaerobic selenocysteine-containing dehydrogenase